MFDLSTLNMRKPVQVFTAEDGATFTVTRVSRGVYLIDCPVLGLLVEGKKWLVERHLMDFDSYRLKAHKAARLAEEKLAKETTAEETAAPQIEGKLFFSLDLASIYFEDFISGASGDHVSKIGEGFYIIFDNYRETLKPYYKEWQLKKLRKSDLCDLCDLHNCFYYDDSTKAEMIEDLLQVDCYDYYKDYFNNTQWRDLESDYYLSGYSPSDAVKIVIIGDEAKGFYSREYLHNLFYDAPIDGSFEVTLSSGDVIELTPSHYLTDSYEYDKQAVILAVCQEINECHRNNLEIKPFIIRYLEENLPDYLEYL